jgi:hypothetical protein
MSVLEQSRNCLPKFQQLIRQTTSVFPTAGSWPLYDQARKQFGRSARVLVRRNLRRPRRIRKWRIG